MTAESSLFCLTVEYDKQSPNPERVFLGIAKTLEAFKALDIQLASSVDNSIETEMLLEDVERGSIKLWVKNISNRIPESAIEDLEYKKIIGHYLVKAKYYVLQKCSDVDEIKDAEYVEEIENGIKEIADETGANGLGIYTAPPREALLTSVSKMSEAYELFDSANVITMEDGEGNRLTLNTDFRLTAENIDELCAGETIENDAELILKVRKPDFLADTLWTFKHGTETIQAKIDDKEWLGRYLNGEEAVLPGDSLRVRIHSVATYDNGQNLMKTKYSIIKVIDIVHKERVETTSLKF